MRVYSFVCSLLWFSTTFVTHCHNIGSIFDEGIMFVGIILLNDLESSSFSTTVKGRVGNWQSRHFPHYIEKG